MPDWATIALYAGVVILVIASAGGGIIGWRAYARRKLLGLLVRAEAVDAVGKGLADVMARLAEADDEALAEFASDPQSSERRALHEVATRASILADELDRMPLPRGLIVLAEELGDAAYVVAREAARVDDESTGVVALDGLAAIDLAAVRGYTKRARRSLTEACDAMGLDETAVYGGGLYL